MNDLMLDAAAGYKKISPRRDLRASDLAEILENLERTKEDTSMLYEYAKALYYAGFACGYRQGQAEELRRNAKKREPKA